VEPHRNLSNDLSPRQHPDMAASCCSVLNDRWKDGRLMRFPFETIDEEMAGYCFFFLKRSMERWQAHALPFGNNR
jgi:hypothetical protein